MEKIFRQRGFMQIVLLAIVIIATLAYFNIDMRTILARPEVQKVWHIVVTLWAVYIKPILVYIWTHIGVLPSIPAMPTTASSTIAI
ncbi:MAG: hypothetical protein HZB11_01800 [Candidatus Yonathbacteria bacterium]|nr:hypothetical protein [Candidatus Yonathbacteria bacterium]